MTRIMNRIRNLGCFSSAANGKIKLSKLPWYLIIGPAKSGKTTLLENSQISFLPNQQIAQESLDAINAYGSCNFRATPDAVLLDIPSSYMNQTEMVPAWQNLFNKKRANHFVTGVIVTLPISDLTDQSARLQFTNHLKRRIAELKETYGAALPFYFAITKCDLIPGFLDFFAHSGIDELSQAWGITIPPLPANAALLDVFNNRFSALIKRLNKQLIWRLHQERGTFERVFIKDFPLQIERLKETLVDVLSALTAGQNRFGLQGVYLTSANQHPPEENIIQYQPSPTNETRQHLQLINTPAMPSRSYFVRQFILQGLHGNYGRPQKTWQKKRVYYGLCASVITLTVAFLSYDVFYSKQKLIAMRGAEVTSFNIIVPEDVPKETKVGDSLTIVS
jgi:type VI secretion system protein ImpL